MTIDSNQNGYFFFLEVVSCFETVVEFVWFVVGKRAKRHDVRLVEKVVLNLYRSNRAKDTTDVYGLHRCAKSSFTKRITIRAY